MTGLDEAPDMVHASTQMLMITCGGSPHHHKVATRWRCGLLNAQSISITTVVNRHGECGEMCTTVDQYTERRKINSNFSSELFYCIPTWMKRWQSIINMMVQLEWSQIGCYFKQKLTQTRVQLSLVISCCGAPSGNAQTADNATDALGFYKLQSWTQQCTQWTLQFTNLFNRCRKCNLAWRMDIKMRWTKKRQEVFFLENLKQPHEYYCPSNLQKLAVLRS